MGSVIDYIECPNCKGEDAAVSDYYYKTGEEYIFCTECGYQHNFYYERNEDGSYKLEDPTKPADLLNLIPIDEEIKNPYGTYKIKYKEASGHSLGTLEKEEDFGVLSQQINEGDIENLEYCEVKRFINGKFVTERL